MLRVIGSEFGPPRAELKLMESRGRLETCYLYLLFVTFPSEALAGGALDINIFISIILYISIDSKRRASILHVHEVGGHQ